MALQGIIFDVDGTLVLSNDAHAYAYVDAFKEFGYEVAFEQVRPLIGMGGDKLMPTVVPGLNHDEGVGKAISERRTAIFTSRYLPALQPANGSRQLVEHLRDAGLRIVVASSAKKEELDHLLKAGQVDGLIDDATTASEAKESKPAPDVVDVALKKLEVEPNQTIMIGDTPYDIQSARGCGVRLIAVRCGGWKDEDLKGAVAIYDDPADLLAHYDESPLAQTA